MQKVRTLNFSDRVSTAFFNCFFLLITSSCDHNLSITPRCKMRGRDERRRRARHLQQLEISEAVKATHFVRSIPSRRSSICRSFVLCLSPSHSYTVIDVCVYGGRAGEGERERGGREERERECVCVCMCVCRWIHR